MARHPESVDGLVLDMSALPLAPEYDCGEPQVGDIYRSHGGQPALWWIVGHVQGELHSTMIYLVFNMRGQIVGTSKAATYYLRQRRKVGHCPIPPLIPEWIAPI